MPAEPILDQWVRRRTQMGASTPLIWIDPKVNVLVGFPTIAKYLGIRSWATLYQWVEIYGFPAIKRPDGMWMTTMTAIDQWLFLASEADNDSREWSRGSGKRVDIALRRLQARKAERDARIKEGLRPDGPDGAKPWAASGGSRDQRSPGRSGPLPRTDTEKGQKPGIQTETTPRTNSPPKVPIREET